MNSKIYYGNVQPNSKEYKIWVNNEGSIKTYDTTQGTWSEVKGGASNTQPAPAEKITFTVVDGAGTETTYAAEKGMTWKEFGTSQYNTEEWPISEFDDIVYIYYIDRGGWNGGESDVLTYVSPYYGLQYINDNYVHPDDFIIANHKYGKEHDSWGIGGGVA